MKFGRTFELTIELDRKTHDTVVISDPLTLEFHVRRSTLASANEGSFAICNLKEQTRKHIYQDSFQLKAEDRRRIILKAGYHNQNATIFQGNIMKAHTIRRNVELLTVIDAFDGGDAIINAFTSKTFPAGTSLKDMLLNVIKDMLPHSVTTGTLSDFQEKGSRGTSLCGNTWNVISNLVSGKASHFIDMEKVHILRPEDCIEGPIRVINSETGLLGIPERFDARLDIKMLFEPHIMVGQLVELQSIEKMYNGLYQVIGVFHSGTISGAVGGACVTELTLYAGTKPFNVTNEKTVG